MQLLISAGCFARTQAIPVITSQPQGTLEADPSGNRQRITLKSQPNPQSNPQLKAGSCSGIKAVFLTLLTLTPLKTERKQKVKAHSCHAISYCKLHSNISVLMCDLSIGILAPGTYGKLLLK